MLTVKIKSKQPQYVKTQTKTLLSLYALTVCKGTIVPLTVNGYVNPLVISNLCHAISL